MHVARRTRCITLLIAVCAILFGQLALAGYSCPGPTKAAEIAQMVEAEMPCAETMSRAMDEERTGLCHAHCQSAQSSPDTYQPPLLASLAQLGPVLVLASVASASAEGRASFVDPGPPDAGPPLTIRNCCFRN